MEPTDTGIKGAPWHFDPTDRQEGSACGKTDQIRKELKHQREERERQIAWNHRRIQTGVLLK